MIANKRIAPTACNRDLGSEIITRIIIKVVTREVVFYVSVLAMAGEYGVAVFESLVDKKSKSDEPSLGSQVPSNKGKNANYSCDYVYQSSYLAS